jgi:NhaA family Na+:H+ antiporter
MTRIPGRRTTAAFIRSYLETEVAGGALLVGASLVALLWANSPWQIGYVDLWHTEAGLFDLRHWVNEALMAVFFLVVALEVKRELLEGALRERRSAALPVAAAVGGMVVPALLYLAVNTGGGEAGGWGVPMATDIAFAMGVLALVAPGIPASLRVFLLTLAVVDDIGAIVVIAVAYSSDVDGRWLLAAGALVAAMIAVRRLVYVELAMAVVLWFTLHEAGVHATLAGVIAGLTLPVWPALEARLHSWSSLLIVPLFALANAGVTFTSTGVGDAATSPVTWGIGLGLVVGKPLGIVGAAWLARRTGVADLPGGVTWRQLSGVAALGGIGFTVSIFITGLAFDAPATVDEAKIAILAATLLAVGLGALLLRGVSDGRDETASART